MWEFPHKTKSPQNFGRRGGVEEKHKIIKYKMYSKWKKIHGHAFLVLLRSCNRPSVPTLQRLQLSRKIALARVCELFRQRALWNIQVWNYLFPESLCIQEKSFGALSLEMQCQFWNREKNTVFDIPFSETMELLSVCSSYGYELLSVIDLARHSIFYFTAWMFWLWYFAAATVLRILSPEGWLAVVVFA